MEALAPLALLGAIESGAVAFGAFRLDISRSRLWRSGILVAVQARVLDAIGYLVEHRDRVVSVAELLRELWPGAPMRPNTVHWTVNRARKALDQTSSDGPICTVRGHGYRFVETVWLDADDQTQGSSPRSPPPAVSYRETAELIRLQGVNAAVVSGG